MAGKGRPQRLQRGFVRITHIRCPDCDVENRLTTDGRAVIVSGGQLRGATQYVGLTKASVGCETCEGKGYLEVDSNSVESIDPYALRV